METIAKFLITLGLALVPPTPYICFPPEETIEEVIEYQYYDVNLDSDIQEYIIDECLRQFETIEIGNYYLPLVVINIIRWESGFNAENDNGKCCGLMSVTYNLSDSIIEAEEITELIDPYQNIRAGIHILKNKYDIISESIDEYSDTEIITFILEAYHIGLKFEDFKPNKEYKYVNNILESYDNTSICAKEDLNDS